MAGTSRVIDPDSRKRDRRPKGVGDRVLRVLSHPIRIEVLRVLYNRKASPKELAEELGESLGNVSYHCKFLRLEGCIELCDTEPRRGAIEHFYRAKEPPAHDERSWAKLPKAEREEVSGETVRNLLGEAVRALNAGTFDASPDRRLSWMPMELDEQGWRELTERQTEWLEELERIESKAAKRLAKGDAPGKRVVAGVMGFETPPGPGFASTREAER